MYLERRSPGMPAGTPPALLNRAVGADFPGRSLCAALQGHGRLGATCAFTTARAAGVANYSDSELQNGPTVCTPGAPNRRSSSTSTTTGRYSRPATPSSHIHERSDYEHEDAHALRRSVCDALPAIYGLSRILNALSSFFWKISYACG